MTTNSVVGSGLDTEANRCSGRSFRVLPAGWVAKVTTIGIFLIAACVGATASAALLQNGVPATGLAGAQGAELQYTFQVPAGATSLTFQMSGGSGDADLYVRYGAAPTTGTYDCRPYLGGNNEPCAMPNATAGTWYVMVRGYAAFANVTLVATYTAGGGGGNTPPTANAGADLNVTAGALVTLSGSGSDPDGPLSTYAWSQTAPASPNVGLANANTATASFTAPTVAVSTVFTFKLTVTDGQGATGSDSVNVTVAPAGGGGGGNQLQNGVPATGLTGASGATLQYTFQVPAGATSLTFQMSGGSGDADLYVRYGATPTTSTFDCRPYVGGNNETCALAPTVGTWYVMVRGYTAFTNVALVATYASGGGGVTQLQPGTSTTGLAGSAGQALYFTVDVPAGATSLIIQMIGTAGDADLYVRYGASPTISTYDCRPYIGNSNETCAMPSATAGTWYVMVRGYSAFANISLNATYATTGGTVAIPPPVPNAAACFATPRESAVLAALPCPAGGSGLCGNFSIVLNQNGTKGTATITDPATGQFKYTPLGTTSGVDTFGYVATDSVTGVPYTATGVVIVKPRIMPLGDSITAGVIYDVTPTVPTRVGYRKPLYDILVAAGYPFDFVGSQNYGYAVASFDPDNEGHPGWSSSEIVFGTSYGPYQDPACPTCKLVDWLNAKKPDIVLLHIGTNNFKNDATDVAAILNTINLWSTGVSGNPVAVFLAQIINRNPYQTVDVLGYNTNLALMAQNRQSVGAGPTTFLVNQESALNYPTDLLSDPGGLHPDANGYAKMANRWYGSLIGSGLMQKCP